MFRKKTTSIAPSSNEDRRSVSQSLRTPPGQHRHQPEPRRQPDSQIGIARLLEAYDDYPRVVADLDNAVHKLEIAEEQAHLADTQRDEMEQELMTERDGRKADGIKAKEDLAAAEVAREKKIRGDLEPKIKDLETKLKTVTAEKNKLDQELKERRAEMSKWIAMMEKIQKDRKGIEEREAKALEDRKKVDKDLKDLDVLLLDGLKEAALAPDERAKVKAEKKAAKEKDTDTTEVEEEEVKVEKKPAKVSPWA
jgi:chromosome segregation ATPase